MGAGRVLGGVGCVGLGGWDEKGEKRGGGR